MAQSPFYEIFGLTVDLSQLVVADTTVWSPRRLYFRHGGDPVCLSIPSLPDGLSSEAHWAAVSGDAERQKSVEQRYDAFRTEMEAAYQSFLDAWAAYRTEAVLFAGSTHI